MDKATPRDLDPAEGYPADGRSTHATRELQRLQRLNTALSGLLAGRQQGDESYYSAAYDRPETGERPSGRLDGDFFWVRRLGSSVVVVFGDAEGHHAYAGGLKMFASLVLAVLSRHQDRESLTAADIVDHLRKAFALLAASDFENTGQPLEDGGIDVVVIVINDKGEMQLASAVNAEMPLFLLQTGVAERAKRLPLVRQGGKSRARPLDQGSSRAKAIGFASLDQRIDGVPGGTQLQPFKVDLTAVDKIVLMTDGFSDLRRRRPDAERSEGLSAKHLQRMVLAAAKEAADGAPKAVVSGILHRMDDWRRGCVIDQDDDDDRLVLVLDVKKTVALLRDSRDER